MKPFWKGFEDKIASQSSTKRHAIVLYWSSEFRDVKDNLDKTRVRHPTIKVKTVKISGEPVSVKAHKISVLPTIILLKNGQEVDRISGRLSRSLLDQFFRKAVT
jgi:thioredoxin-like negative regulator of GroEL